MPIDNSFILAYNKNIVWSYFKNTLIRIFRYDFYKILSK